MTRPQSARIRAGRDWLAWAEILIFALELDNMTALELGEARFEMSYGQWRESVLPEGFKGQHVKLLDVVTRRLARESGVPVEHFRGRGLLPEAPADLSSLDVSP